MNFKHKYTDRNYLSLGKLKTKNKKLIKDEQIYRKKHSFFIGLETFKGCNLFITQTPWILQKEIQLISNVALFQQNLLYEIGGSYNMKTIIMEFFAKGITNQLFSLRKYFDIKITKRQLYKMVINEYIPETENEKDNKLMIDVIYESFDKFMEPKEIIKNINNVNDISELFDDIENKKKIWEKYYRTIEALFDQNINSILVKLSMFIYMMNEYKYFSKVNHKLVIYLSSISFLANSFFEPIIRITNSYKIFHEYETEIIDAFKKGVNEKGDLTFIYLKLIDILTELLENAKLKINKISIDKEITSELSIKEKNLSMHSLLKKYPYLSKREARFFVSHCETKESYTIKDFMEYTNSSYETSRKSMDKLAHNQFYSKNKIGKKYIYQAQKIF